MFEPIRAYCQLLLAVYRDHGLFWAAIYLLAVPVLLPMFELDYRTWDDDLLDALAESERLQDQPRNPE